MGERDEQSHTGIISRNKLTLIFFSLGMQMVSAFLPPFLRLELRKFHSSHINFMHYFLVVESSHFLSKGAGTLLFGECLHGRNNIVKPYHLHSIHSIHCSVPNNRNQDVIVQL
ncbi:hypothetical protein MEU_05438 [Candida albicans P37005]|nr:hypothetical protein MEU_05438 [Candida albicans P37005]